MVKKNKKTKFEEMFCPVCMHGVFRLTLKFIILIALTGIAAIGLIIIKDTGIPNIDPIVLWCMIAIYTIIMILTGAIFFYSKNRNMFETMSGLLFLVFLITADPGVQSIAISFGIVALILQMLSAFSIDIKLKINKMEIPLSYWTHSRNYIKRTSQKGNKTK